MTRCVCDLCMLARTRAIAAFTEAGEPWWLHWEEINQDACNACAEGGAEGYLLPPLRSAPRRMQN